MKLFVALIFFFSCFAFAGGPSVRVQSSAEITTSHILLGDIAVISADSDEVQKKLEQLDLGSSPTLGREVRWTATDVSQKLHIFVSELSGVQIKIPDTVTIKRVNHSITAASVRQKIKEAVRVTLPDPSWQFEVSDVQLPSGLDSLQATDFQIVPQMQRPKGASTFELLVQQENGAKRFWIPAKIKYFCAVATLVRQIEPHSKLVESDVKWQRRDVTYLNDIPATKNEFATGVSRSILGVGTMLLRSNLEREMALRFGQEVDLLAGDDSFSISSKGVAQQNGFIGDIVKVRSENSNKILDGVVIAKGVVNVRY